MNQKELRELIEFLIEKDITEFELERGDVKVRVKRGADVHYVPQVQVAPAAAQAQPAAPAAVPGAPAAPPLAGSAAGISGMGAPRPAEEQEGVHVVRSPIVGTFYEAPSPGSPPFIKIGDRVESGQVLCIIEAMKLMNEIEADATGEIVQRFVQNGQPVEYGQSLFGIRTE
jgi:acetyl-CoA carboxylase biotin carboxyl carrier protein